MTRRDEVIVVIGATGQQGGATARALADDGWRVRALARDPSSPGAATLARSGVEVVRGDLRDRASLDAALRGAHGVFSVQPSSGQPEYGVTDEDERRYGVSVVDAAKGAGVRHLVYTSVAGVTPGAGVGHFESKWAVEQHVRASGVPATIVRPVAFMEILLQPFVGLAQGRLEFFGAPERAMQFIAVEDIGGLVARIFADPATHVGRTFDLAGDELTGRAVAEKIQRATGRALSYARFPDEFLRQSPTLRRLVDLAERDNGPAGSADLVALRALHPGLLTFDAWLAKTGRAQIDALFAAAP